MTPWRFPTTDRVPSTSVICIPCREASSSISVSMLLARDTYARMNLHFPLPLTWRSRSAVLKSKGTLDCWKQISAPRIRSNPPEYLSIIWVIWSEFPHSSFSATSPAEFPRDSGDAWSCMFFFRISPLELPHYGLSTPLCGKICCKVFQWYRHRILIQW